MSAFMWWVSAHPRLWTLLLLAVSVVVGVIIVRLLTIPERRP